MDQVVADHSVVRTAFQVAGTFKVPVIFWLPISVPDIKTVLQRHAEGGGNGSPD